MKVDFLIVGQGLAGSLLAWHLIDAHKRVLVVDFDEAVTSSKVAAGLVTPLTGFRFFLPEDLDRNLNYARRFYWGLEERSGITFYHHSRIARLFANSDEVDQWKHRMETERNRYSPYHAPLTIDPELINAPLGGFEMREAGWLDMPAFLEYTRQSLLERAAYAIGRVDARDLKVTHAEVRWKNVTSASVIFCEGWRGKANPYFDWVPLTPVAGDILELEIPELASETRILSKSGWLIPLGDGRFRAGSTYRRGIEGSALTPAGQEEVLEKVADIARHAPSSILSHQCAVRPTIQHSQVFMGRHGSLPGIAFFNGMGSKGVTNGPWYAHRMSRHLLYGEPLPPEADLFRLYP